MNGWLPVDWAGWGQGRYKDYKEAQSTFWVKNMFIILNVVMVSQVHTCQNLQIINFKHMQFIVNCTSIKQFLKSRKLTS